MTPLPCNLRRVLALLNELPCPGERVFLVGGCVRDLLLGRAVKDLDLVTDGDPKRLAEALAARMGGTAFPLRESQRAYRVAAGTGADGIGVDVLPLTGGLEADLLRRDFTVNAMALSLPVNLETPGRQVIDPARGLADLQARRLRCVSADVFRKDPVRLLRGVRFAAVLGFSLDGPTEALTRAQAPLLSRAPAERVRDELFLLLELPDATAWVRRLDDLGLLAPILPELESLRGLDQNANHHLDVWEHTLEALRFCDQLIEGRELPPDVAEAARRHLDQPLSPPRARKQLLRFAVLLHDIAKPRTRAVRPDGVVTFWGHDEAGAAMAEEVAARLRLSRREIVPLRAAVRCHLRAGFLAAEAAVSARQRYRLFREMDGAVVETLLLSVADRLAARGPWAKPEQVHRHQAFAVEMLRLYFDRHPLAWPRLPVDGHRLMHATGLRPGPELGNLMEAVREATAVGEVSTTEEALRFARDWTVAKRKGRQG